MLKEASRADLIGPPILIDLSTTARLGPPNKSANDATLHHHTAHPGFA